MFTRIVRLSERYELLENAKRGRCIVFDRHILYVDMAYIGPPRT